MPLSLSFSQDSIYGDYLLSSAQKIVSLDLEGAKLVDTLKLLSQQTGMNFVSTEAVKERTLTMYLDKVPLKEALDIIFKANNLTYEYYPEGNMFVVKEMGKPTIELKSKVYRLQYVRIKPTRMQKEITQVFENQNQGSGGSGGQQGSSGGSSSSGGGEDLKEQGIKNAVKKLLTEYGKIGEDPITNSLIVVDVPSQFPIIDEVIASLDMPSPRVMIEVEMLDVSKGLIDQMGFKWGNGDNQGLFVSYTGPKRTSGFPFAESMIKGKLADTNYNMDGYSKSMSMGTLDLSNFGAVMQFFIKDSSTKVIARPKILTLSNETAEVNITTDEAIGVTSTTAGQTGAVSQNIERAETGTKLRVTPQINEGTGEVTLFVEVFTTEAIDSELSLSGAGISGKVRNPEERGTRTVLRVKDGETFLIGGLIKKKNANAMSKVPFLGDIPLMGKLFRYKDNTSSDRELLVFLTPRIMNDKPSSFASGGQLLPREQDFSKRETVNVALDQFSRY